MKYLTMLFSMFFALSVYGHHMAPEDMQDQIEETLLDVGSPHLLSDDTDPSLVDLVDIPTGMTEVDYVATIEGDNISELLDAVDEILQMLEDGNDVADFEVAITFDPDTGIYTVTLYVDFVT